MNQNQHQLVGSPISLYTGKVRAYLRYKQIPFQEILSSGEVYQNTIMPRVGFPIIPVVETDEDETLQDSTDIIDFFESRYPASPIYPATPLQKLVALLLEIFGDEWLVIPAMHYRWNLPENKDYAIRQFGATAAPNVSKEQQYDIGLDRSSRFNGMLPNLGITEKNIAAIEKSYLQLLADLNAHFQQHLFLLGSRPSIADYGLIGPLYAHLFLDPASGKIMEKEAPDVVSWVHRVHSPETFGGEFLADDEIPSTLMPILERMFSEQLPVLLSTIKHVNEWAIDNPEENKIPRRIGFHEFSIEGVIESRGVMPANLWMWQRAVDFYNELDDQSKEKLKTLFSASPELIDALETPIPVRIKRENFRFLLDR